MPSDKTLSVLRLKVPVCRQGGKHKPGVDGVCELCLRKVAI